MRAAKRAGDEHVASSTRLNKLRIETAGTRGRLEGLPDLAELRRQEREWGESHAAQVAEAAAQVRTARREHVALQRQSRSGSIKIDAEQARQAYEVAQNRVSELHGERSSLSTKIEAAAEDLDFFDENSQCPSCGQEIDEETADRHRRELTEQLVGLRDALLETDASVSAAKADVTRLRDDWQQVVQTNAAVERDAQLLSRQVRDKLAEVERMEKQAERLASEANPHAAQRQQVADSRRELRMTLAEQEKQEAGLLAEMASLEYWRGGFRKMRLFCLDRVLGELEIETRNVMYELGLLGWSIVFRTATETKSGTMKLGVQVEIKAPEFQSSLDMMSPGESQRARLAVSLGLANIIQRRAGVRWTSEVLDEPTAWLSDQGVEDLLETLASRASSQDRSIWLCDHRALSAGSFLEVVQVVKDQDGSRIQ